ncbi:hypothetical protein B0T25DRAFT_442365 [Lasiosphaeria hispida]|uniref:RRM domain-containing protein n=1 Tax=Lasiosphaeria hispida TaxID=260671 RepID=A0AAJ0HWZ5_9PEZI|nr:hypothetical protein B0T25DRAFT_442365 [Lasiosphaeria hispida]
MNGTDDTDDTGDVDEKSDKAKGKTIETPASKRVGMGTQFLADVPANPFNQTEPRNFAPRPRMNGQMPPPVFNLGSRPGTAGTVGVSAPPGSSNSATPVMNQVAPAVTSQALILPAIPQGQVAQVAPGPAAEEVRVTRSEKLNALTSGNNGLPGATAALHPDNFPFMEGYNLSIPSNYGVVKIKNIPFNSRRTEIIAFLGRNSRILNDTEEPVHIIMERVTSKTQDAYVEFMTFADAVKAVERHNELQKKGRQTRLGDRPVEVELSSQGALMRDLFPFAAGIFWNGSIPQIQEPVEGQPWKTFKGFVTEEEMTMLVKFVEAPGRSPFARDCNQRPFETMISTLKKLPWFAAEHITIRQRWVIYTATMNLIHLLRRGLNEPNPRREKEDSNLTPQLLKRLYTAAMLCPGFSVVQKDNIAFAAGWGDANLSQFNQPRFAELWAHQHILVAKPGVPNDLLEWYIAVIREETTRHMGTQSLTYRRNAFQLRDAAQERGYFGFLWLELGFPEATELGKMTLKEVAMREIAMIEGVLSRAFLGN